MGDAIVRLRDLAVLDAERADAGRALRLSLPVEIEECARAGARTGRARAVGEEDRRDCGGLAPASLVVPPHPLGAALDHTRDWNRDATSARQPTRRTRVEVRRLAGRQ